MKRFWNKALAYILVFAMCFSVVNVPVYAHESNITEDSTGVETASEAVTEERTTEESVLDNNTEATTEENTIDSQEIVDENDGSTWDQVTTENIFEGENYRVTFTLTSYWDTGYNANIKIENIGDSIIENWYLGFESKNKITNIWNAEISENVKSEYIIKNAGWNQDISVQGCVEFGISGEGVFEGFPETYELVSTISGIEEQDYLIEYTVESDWGSGFTGNIKITNNTEVSIEDWVLEFDFDRNITNIWNGVIEKHEGNHYVIKNANYNSNIMPNESITFGFSGSDGDIDDIPYNYEVNAFQKGYSVKFDVGEGKITNIPKTQSVQKGMFAVEPEKPEKESNYFMGWYLDKEFTQLFEFDSVPIESNVVLYALWFDPTSDVDTDEDGLTDEFEKVIGSNPRNNDTDGDGLSDCVEVEILGTEPTLLDTDGDGISDGDEDYDEDGLSNKDECSYNTNLLNKDTDSDGLTDYDEAKVHFSNPLLEDTDNDVLSDKSEVRLGTNPNNEDSDGNGIKDGDEIYTQDVLKDNFHGDLFKDNIAVPQINIAAKGDVNERIFITEYNGHLKGDEREYVGKVIEITDSEMESGELIFSIDSDYDLKSYNYGTYTTNGLLICYNDGENTTPLESTFDEDSKIIKCQLQGDGIYFIVDIVAWIESYGVDLEEYVIEESSSAASPMTFSLRDSSSVTNSDISKTSSVSTDDEDLNIATIKVKGQVDIVFVVDTTGSMSSYIRNVKNNIIAFVEELDAADIRSNFALVDYRDITCDGQTSANVKENKEDNSNWFKSAEEFKKQIEALSVSGGGDAPETAIDALEMARQLDMRSSSQKFFILVTDAGYKVANNYGIQSMDEMINLLVADEINTSVVSNTTYKSAYYDLYTKTGGVFANVGGNFKDELLGIADNIKDNTNDGYWIALNGLLPQIVKLDEEPSLSSSADTDSDSLLDNKELSSVIPVKKINVMDYFLLIDVPVEVRGKYIDVYDYYSNPAKEDTDGDGLFDGKAVDVDGKTAIPQDPEPKIINGIEGVWAKQVEQYKNGVVATEYADDYNWNVPELSDKIEGFPTNKYIADLIVEQLLKLKETANYHETEIRNIALLIKKYCNGEMATIAGAYLLNFVQDTDGQAYHSQPDTWQRYFGYNEFYDDVFRIGSYMHYKPINFKTTNTEYRLWMWKGDYWNLHSGAEIGLYYLSQPEQGSDTLHYDVVDFEVPMTLSLYSYNSSTDIDTIFAWAPDEPQWWVTGFSGQNPEFLYPDENKMVAVGSIDLSGHKDIYEGLKNEGENGEDLENKAIINRYLLFDDTSSTVWVCWYEGVK